MASSWQKTRSLPQAHGETVVRPALVAERAGQANLPCRCGEGSSRRDESCAKRCLILAPETPCVTFNSTCQALQLQSEDRRFP